MPTCPREVWVAIENSGLASKELSGTQVYVGTFMDGDYEVYRFITTIDEKTTVTSDYYIKRSTPAEINTYLYNKYNYNSALLFNLDVLGEMAGAYDGDIFGYAGSVWSMGMGIVGFIYSEWFNIFIPNEVRYLTNQIKGKAKNTSVPIVYKVKNQMNHKKKNGFLGLFGKYEWKAGYSNEFSAF